MSAAGMSIWAWIGLGVYLSISGAFLLMSYLGYRREIRWFEEFDRRNPGVAEKLGVRPRGGKRP